MAARATAHFIKWEDCLLNQLGSVAVKTPGDCSFYVYCVNAHYYT